MGFRELFEQELREVVRAQGRSIACDELLRRVSDRCHKGTDSSAGADPSQLMASFIEDEVQAGRIVVVNGERARQSISLSSAGVVYYTLAKEDVPMTHAAAGRVSAKQAAQAKYLNSARVLADVMDTLKSREPALLLKDARGLPDLVRQNISVIEDLEELNRDVRERITQTQDRIDFLELNGAET